MPTRARPMVIGLVAVLSLTIVAVLLSQPGGPPIMAPIANGSPQEPQASVGATSSSAPSPSTTEAFAEIEEQVVELRGLPAPDIGPAEVIDREQLATELEQVLDEEWTDEELHRANLTLQAMGLLTADQDLRELTEILLEEQVIGFYDPAEKRMVVVSDDGGGAIARITYAHEYTHALQDAAFDTFAAREELTDDDAVLARQALEEGDATVVMVEWVLQHLSPADLLGIGATPVPDTADVPDWMLRQLEFPYLAGLTFVRTLFSSGGWAAVDAAYDDPPVSTSQIIHPEKYLSGEEPVMLDPLELAAGLGDGWGELEPTTMGEAMTDIWLAELGAEAQLATGAAAGWRGDRLAVAEGPDGEWTMTWRLAWSTPADADEFAEAYAATDPQPGIAATLRQGPTETVVVHASSEALLDSAVALIGD